MKNKDIILVENCEITEKTYFDDITIFFNGGKFLNNTGETITLHGNNTRIVATNFNGQVVK